MSRMNEEKVDIAVTDKKSEMVYVWTSSVREECVALRDGQ